MSNYAIAISIQRENINLLTSTIHIGKVCSLRFFTSLTDLLQHIYDFEEGP